MQTENRDIVITDMIAEDLSDIVAIERSLFPSPWSEEMFLRELSLPLSHPLTAKTQEWKVAGYIVFWIVAPEVHLHTIAVRKEWQHRGVASLLMADMIRRAKEAGARAATLEVRPSNRKARALYRKFGFAACTVRRRYYADTGEDALVMWADLGGRG